MISAQKNRKMTTVEISIELYDRLYRIKTELEEILEITINFDELFTWFLFLRANSILAIKRSKTEQVGRGSRIYQVAKLFADGYSFRDIYRRKGLTTTQSKREIKKALKWFCQHQE